MVTLSAGTIAISAKGGLPVRHPLQRRGRPPTQEADAASGRRSTLRCIAAGHSYATKARGAKSGNAGKRMPCSRGRPFSRPHRFQANRGALGQGARLCRFAIVQSNTTGNVLGIKSSTAQISLLSVSINAMNINALNNTMGGIGGTYRLKSVLSLLNSIGACARSVLPLRARHFAGYGVQEKTRFTRWREKIASRMTNRLTAM